MDTLRMGWMGHAPFLSTWTRRTDWTWWNSDFRLVRLLVDCWSTAFILKSRMVDLGSADWVPFFSSILGSIKSRSGTTWKVWYFMRYFVVHQQFGGRKQIHYSPTLVNISSPNPIQWLVIWKWVNTYQLPSFLGDQHPLTSYCSPGWGLL